MASKGDAELTSLRWLMLDGAVLALPSLAEKGWVWFCGLRGPESGKPGRLRKEVVGPERIGLMLGRPGGYLCDHEA